MNECRRHCASPCYYQKVKFPSAHGKTQLPRAQEPTHQVTPDAQWEPQGEQGAKHRGNMTFKPTGVERE